MKTRQDVVVEARRWLGTPFQHQGRAMGVGVDCAGVVVQVGKALGLTGFDTTDYGRLPHSGKFMRVVQQELDQWFGEPEPGLLGVFRWRTEPQHIGVFAEINGRITLIHAWEKMGRCVEASFDSAWRGRLVSVWKFRGMGD